ncbi:MAG TPA: bifunctional aldolase/short-chain dehydrogenase [Vicinamibacterales bacterium]|nr:bifunctional aldolase/short-chain dehydrogenase [Vicinamibacterales bacterium]
MRSLWNEAEARRFVDQHAAACGEDVAIRTYSARLLGADRALVLHGGGNTSVKGTLTDRLGARQDALFVKASGADLAAIDVEGHLALALSPLRRLRALDHLTDEEMVEELRRQLWRPGAGTPSIEALVHAFLPARFVDHTHAGAVLALTNQPGGEGLAGEALGHGVIVLPYVTPGFKLAKATADAFDAAPGARAVVWARHGLVTFGDTARESYEAMVALVSRAESYLARRVPEATVVARTDPGEARNRAARIAPVLRGLLAAPPDEPAGRRRRVVLRSLTTPQTLAFLEAPGARGLAQAPPLTSDHLIRTGPWPAWVDEPDFDDSERLADQLRAALRDHAQRYASYLRTHASLMPDGVGAFDSSPRVVLLPGLGAFCAGRDLEAATIARDITEHTLAVKALAGAIGRYEGLPDEDLFRMEYRSLQHAKLAARSQSLTGEVAIVTGAAGAIGSGICRALLEEGCLVAATDLAGPHLESLVADLAPAFGSRLIGVPMDVGDAAAVASAWREVTETWGGIDLVIVNAGIAHVSPLDSMDLEAFRRLERVNVEGTLLVIAEAARHFRTQNSGGDVVLVSTKNVFAPGAKFGAYSATKAAAHQLARIASLELAELDVRVNMVSPDAVFSDGRRKSGLWAEVGPDRMRARGLDEAGLEAYYRSRNLLKAGVTARHVANAVLFFATRQTPTTGATIPVDGGLPDATPR